MTDVRTKGTGVASFVAVLKERLSAAELEALKAQSPPAGRALLERRILPVEWIPLSEQTALSEVVFRDIFKGDEAAFIALVHEASQRDLKGMYRMFVKVMSPAFVAKQASRIFRTYVENGEMHVVRERRDGQRLCFELEVENYSPLPLTWLILRGYIEAPLLLTGAKNLVVRLREERGERGGDAPVVLGRL